MAGVRVVAGCYRGFRVRTRPGLEVRPTADRVKEALFAILGPQLDGASVVDCFAGTGSLGIEALSRGAAKVVFVENDLRSLEVLRQNLGRLPEPSDWAVIRADVLELAVWAAGALPADLILADPPYRRELDLKLLRVLAGVQALQPGGMLMVEHETGACPEDPSWATLQRRRYGDTTVSFFSPNR
jgi:16S rRNA (guanine(966)-N(2))-methyltransferase RsmD